MNSGPTLATLRRQLIQRGHPSTLRCFLSGGCLFLRWGFWTVIIAMFWARMNWPSQWQLQMTITVGWLAAGFVGSGLLRSLKWRVDPRSTARSFDEQFDTDDRMLAAIEGGADGPRTSFDVLLLRQAAGLLARHPAMTAAPASIRLPGYRQLIVVTLLVALIWLAPPLGRGGIGEPNGAGDSDVAVVNGTPSSGAGSSSEQTNSNGDVADSSWAAISSFSAKTDRGTYLLGEEIHLSLRFKTEAESSAGDPLVVVLIADGEHEIELPVEWTLPAGVGEILVDDFELKKRLEELGCYRRGLLALDVEVRSAYDAGIGLRAPRVTIQISENITKDKTMAQLPAKPEATQKPKPNPQQPNQPDEAPNKPKGRENADDQTGPEPPPIGDIDANPVVVEPLFTGAERKRREVRVYNREEEEGDNRKERAPAKPPTIKPQPNTPIRFSRKSQLRGGDRQLVKRYFERVRSRHRKSGDGR